MTVFPANLETLDTSSRQPFMVVSELFTSTHAPRRRTTFQVRLSQRYDEATQGKATISCEYLEEIRSIGREQKSNLWNTGRGRWMEQVAEEIVIPSLIDDEVYVDIREQPAPDFSQFRLCDLTCWQQFRCAPNIEEKRVDLCTQLQKISRDNEQKLRQRRILDFFQPLHAI
jgi:hypothetical protein